MGFVEYNQVPGWRVHQVFDPLGTLKRVEAGDYSIVLCKRIALAIGHITLAAENFEIEVKGFIQLPAPVIN